jgi:hypothetical protein
VSGLDPVEVRRLLQEAESGANADERGKRYEALLSYVFEAVPGTLAVPDTRNYFGGEQVDLAISNGGGFVGLPNEFLVECKNYKQPVDSKAVGYFLFICLTRSSRLAVIAAANGLTGDPSDSSYAYSLALKASGLGCRLVVMTTADLLSLTSAEDLTDMLRHRWLEAFANGGIGTG